LCFAITATVGCERLTRPNVSGVWKGSIQASEQNGKNKWHGVVRKNSMCRLFGSMSHCYVSITREPAQFIAWEMLLNAKEFWPDGILANKCVQ
jgi:hypothetical protein